jgi:hypothetical protein
MNKRRKAHRKAVNPKPSNAIMQKRKRARKAAERNANPDVQFRRIVERNRQAREAIAKPSATRRRMLAKLAKEVR